MRASALFAVIVVIASACTLPVSQTSVPPSSEPASTTSTRVASSPPPSTTTTVVVDEGDLRLLLMFDDSVVIRDGGGPAIRIRGDFEIPLRAAVGDRNGGIIYQYARTVTPFPPDAILHLPAGATEPRVLIAAEAGQRVRLVDAGPFGGIPQVLYVTSADGPTRLWALPLAGGLPTELSSLTGIVDASFSDLGFAVVRRTQGCTSAAVHGSNGDTIAEWDCDSGVTDVILAADGSPAVAVLRRGEAGLVDLEDHGRDPGWPVDATTTSRLFDFDGTAIAVIGPTGGLRLLRDDGMVLNIGTGSDALRSASLLGAPNEIPETAFLGGIEAPRVGCSAEGQLTRPPEQAGLPAPVAFLRTEIVEAATACDYRALAELAAPEFDDGSAASPLRAWVQAEQNREDVLGQIVAVLNTPHTTVVDEEGTTVYVWPSAVAEVPSEADWEAIVPIYNEEEVDFYRANGYSGMRVMITTTGDWIAAVTGER